MQGPCRHPWRWPWRQLARRVDGALLRLTTTGYPASAGGRELVTFIAAGGNNKPADLHEPFAGSR